MCDECEETECFVCEWCSRWLCETCQNRHECKGKR